MTTTPRWSRFEARLQSDRLYTNPLQEVDLLVTFIAPSGALHVMRGFWDGDLTWRVRFLPGETGAWTFRTACSDATNGGLHKVTGSFACTEATGDTLFSRHGPLRIADSRRHLAHADGTPFFWLADTCWNGPLRSTDAEWTHYLATRAEQKFSAIQWVTTQWIAAPDGDIDGRLPFAGHEQVAVDPAVFQRLDGKLDEINAAGILGAPVLLWAAEWGAPEVMAINPGLTLPEDQCILLARYMVARWGGNAVLWILPGDGVYIGERAGRWQRIGRAVFGQIDHAPVTLHPSGMQWYGEEFRDEPWLDVISYQSGHFGGDETLEWLAKGPPANAWQVEPARPVINLEPNYEGILAFDLSGYRCTDFHVRRAINWSLLVSPTAGVTYGAHGVWGWDDGTGPAVAHEMNGLAPAWQSVLTLPGAQQLGNLAGFMTGLAWWRLYPAPELVVVQPGDEAIGRFVAAAASDEAAVVYIPGEQDVTLSFPPGRLPTTAEWFNPRTGERSPAAAVPVGEHLRYDTPGEGDWLLRCAF